MGKAAARRHGAPLPVRVLSSLLAAGLTLAPLALLLIGLSIHSFQMFRDRDPLVDFIPLPVPSPPPPDPPRPDASHPRPSTAAAAPTSPAPAPQPTPLVALNPAPAAASPLDGTGSGDGAGTGDGRGGNGMGGSGAGAPRAVRGPASWVVMPGTRELMPFNPPRAGRERINGSAVLSCRVLRSRVLADCRVIEERPRNYGFGGAALAASATFRFNPPTLNGEPDENARIEIPVAFNNKR